MTIGQQRLVLGPMQPPRPFDNRSGQTGAGAPKILACSAVDHRSQRLLFSIRDVDRKLCEDRKTPLEHLSPGSLSKSVSINNTISLCQCLDCYIPTNIHSFSLFSGFLPQTFRIVVTQGSLILSTYANDQLQQDMAREELVAKGEMTQEEADEAAEEWEMVCLLWLSLAS